MWVYGGLECLQSKNDLWRWSFGMSVKLSQCLKIWFYLGTSDQRIRELERNSAQLGISAIYV